MTIEFKYDRTLFTDFDPANGGNLKIPGATLTITGDAPFEICHPVILQLSVAEIEDLYCQLHGILEIKAVQKELTRQAELDSMVPAIPDDFFEVVKVFEVL